MKIKEEILQGHFGSDYYLLKEKDDLQYILRAMDEYADQFKHLHKPAIMQDEGSDSAVGEELLNHLYLSGRMKTIHEVIDEFYPTINLFEIGELYSKGKVFMIVCEYMAQFEQAGIYSHVVRPASANGSGVEPLATEAGAQSQSEDIYCFCANGGREGLNGICTNCGNYVARNSYEGAL